MELRNAILDTLARRDLGKSICPSEAARAAAEEGDWRSLLTAIRSEGRVLASEGLIEVTKKGKVVDPETVKGVIRYRLKEPRDD